MGEELGTLDIPIKIDWQKVNRSLNRISSAVKKVSGGMASGIKSALGGIVSVASSVTNRVIGIFTSAFKKIVQIIRNSMLVAGAAISAFLILTTKMAINVEEMESLFKKSFGGMSDDVKDWSDKYSASIKTNKFETMSMLTTMFNISRAMGQSGDAAKETAKELVSMSNDLKSAFNLKGDVAFDKIRSGMIGMSKPLQDLGIDLRVASVEQFALAAGMKKVKGEFSNAQKIIARKGLLKQILANIDVLGDMKDTIDSTQNRIRALTEGFEEWSVKQGKVIKSSKTFLSLLGKVENIAKKLQNTVGGVLARSVAFLDDNFDNIVTTIKSVLTILKPLGTELLKVTTVISKLIIGFAKSAVTMDNFEKIINEINSAFIFMTKKIADFFKDSEKVKQLKEDFKAFKVILIGVGKELLSLTKRFTAWVKETFTLENIKNTMSDIEIVTLALVKAFTLLKDVSIVLGNAVQEVGDKIISLLSWMGILDEETTNMAFRWSHVIGVLVSVVFVTSVLTGKIFGIIAAIGTLITAFGTFLSTAALITTWTATAAFASFPAVTAALLAMAAAVGWVGGKWQLFLVQELLKSLGIFDLVNDGIDSMITKLLELGEILAFVFNPLGTLAVKLGLKAVGVGKVDPNAGFTEKEGSIISRRVNIPSLDTTNIPVASPLSSNVPVASLASTSNANRGITGGEQQIITLLQKQLATAEQQPQTDNMFRRNFSG